jgi:hypothetical protein
MLAEVEHAWVYIFNQHVDGGLTIVKGSRSPARFLLRR